jgi:hypothetical protein
MEKIKEVCNMLYTAVRETGDLIEKVNSITHGRELIEQYEEDDRRNGDYEPDFYDIVDENHFSVL